MKLILNYFCISVSLFVIVIEKLSDAKRKHKDDADLIASLRRLVATLTQPLVLGPRESRGPTRCLNCAQRFSSSDLPATLQPTYSKAYLRNYFPRGKLDAHPQINLRYFGWQ